MSNLQSVDFRYGKKVITRHYRICDEPSDYDRIDYNWNTGEIEFYNEGYLVKAVKNERPESDTRVLSES